MEITDISVSPNTTLKEALKLMDKTSYKVLMILENNIFNGLITIGDVQRTIIANKPLTTKVREFIRKDIIIANTTTSFEEIKQKMLKHRLAYMPVVNEKSELIDVHFWNDIFESHEKIEKKILDIPVVIMAGGKGTRLKPITNVIPKPLIPLGDRTILEHIINRFTVHEVKNFYLSVNYKAEIIKNHFDSIAEKTYEIQYFKEEKPLGTAGSLFLLRDKIKTSFFISNCDILIDQDYAEVYDYHKKNNNELTIVGALKNYTIPYGTLDTLENGLLKSINEKPELNFKVNTGMYILEPHLLNEIPENTFFHITHLMENIIKRNGKVGVFPVSEGAWLDVGNWSEYNETLKKMGEKPFVL